MIAWYWQWLVFILLSSGLFYFVFYVIPLIYKRFHDPENRKNKEIEEILVDEKEPVKTCRECEKKMSKDVLNGVIVDQCIVLGI